MGDIVAEQPVHLQKLISCILLHLASQTLTSYSFVKIADKSGKWDANYVHLELNANVAFVCKFLHQHPNACKDHVSFDIISHKCTSTFSCSVFFACRAGIRGFSHTARRVLLKYLHFIVY